MSCERIDPKDFHGPAATQYTIRSVEELAESPKFKAYVRHVEYKERLYLTWFIAPFTLFGILFFHVAVFGGEGINLFMDPAARSALYLSKVPEGMAALTSVLLLYVIPCILIAPFIGFFEERSRWCSLTVLVSLTCVNVAIVAFGGPRLHYPPFLVTSPPVTALITSPAPRDVAVVVVRDILARRALGLEGFLAAGYAVAAWRRSFWRRAWHPPLPLLTIPLSVGAFGVAWWVVVQTALPLFVDASGDLTAVGSALRWSSVQADPVGAASLCGAVIREVGRRIWLDVVPLWEQRALPAALQNASSCLSLYLAASSMALLHLLVLLTKPVLDFVVDAFFFLLPTDPTIWGLALASSLGGFAYMWHAAEESEYTLYLVGTAALAVCLLFNGFVA